MSASRLGVLALMVVLAPMALRAASVARSDAELASQLRQGQPPADLVPVQRESWCGPKGCGVDLGPLSVPRDEPGLRQQGRRVPLRTLALHHRALPDMDRDPVQGFEVRMGDKRWGMCLEFAHAGLGKSGTFQRWRSVVLAPAGPDGRVRQAYRVMGYWAGCEHLHTSLVGPPSLEMPVIEPADQAGRWQLAHYRCSAQGCARRADARTVLPLPGSEAGEVVITTGP
jgi:hypothetical protein